MTADYYDPRRFAQQTAQDVNPFQDRTNSISAPTPAPSSPQIPPGDALPPGSTQDPNGTIALDPNTPNWGNYNPRYQAPKPYGATPTPSPTSTTPTGSNSAAFGAAWMASGGRTPADLAAFVKAHPEWGGRITGSKGDKITFDNGETYDAVIAAGLGGQGASWYRIDGSQGPMITPTGGVPPGIPYQPGSLGANHDALLQQILTTPALSPQYTQRLQEMQKEQVLRGNQASLHQQQVSAASRGVSGGGENAAVQRRIATDSRNQILSSNREISNASELANRQGFLQALAASLDYQRFLEGAREFGIDDAYRYSALNSSAEQAFINMILNGGV